jgi:hypothetical protein
MAFDSKRTLIANEVVARLAAVYPTFGFVRKFFTGNAQVGNFYIFSMPQTNDTSSTKERGQTKCSFPVSISCWVACDEAEMEQIGNMHLDKIRAALELDDRLSNLVLEYEITDEAVLWYGPGVIDVEIIVMFSYYREAGWAQSQTP